MNMDGDRKPLQDKGRNLKVAKMGKLNFCAILVSFVLAIVFFGFGGHQNKEVFEPLYSKINKEDFYIENLREKKFVSGNIETTKLIEETRDFKRYLIRYKSEELIITGMMNVPLKKRNLPAIILNHAFYPHNKYKTGDGTKESADYLAMRGYLTIASDYRNLGGSDSGPNLFNHLGSLQDVLYILEAVKKMDIVDSEKIGMWGYSNGGWITLKVIAANKGIKVGALFSSMSADDSDNYKAIRRWHPNDIKEVLSLYGDPDKNPQTYAKLSAINYLSDVTTPMIIHQGEKDDVTPLEWSEKLKEFLLKKGKTIEFYTYPGQGHSPWVKNWEQAMKRTLNFYNRYLKD